MTTHVRKQIRDKLKTLLTGLTTTGNNVFFDYVYSIDESELPALSIFTKQESEERITLGFPSVLERTLNFDIYGVCRVNSTYLDVLDEIASEVETRLADNIKLDGLVLYITLKSTQLEINDDANKPTAIIQLSFECKYRTYENNPNLKI